MNKKAQKTLEYDKIIQLLTECAGSSLGQEKCKNLKPSIDLDEIRNLQQETTDALSHLMKKGSISFSGLRDIMPSLKRLEIGSTLGIMELLNISSLLNVATRVKAYSRPDKSEEEDFDTKNEDSLSSRFSYIEPLTNLNNEIKRCIISEEEVSDDASPGLNQVRRTIKNTNQKIHEQLNSVVNSSRSMLQESIVTMRNGRYCLPVKAEYKSSFSGMVHDQSSTGSTLFIEPMSVVKLNNELRELASREQEEIEKLLATLSNLAAEEADALKTNLSVLAELDFIFARAALSKKLQGSEPKFNTRGYINIKKGKHPLIDKHKVVPIDVELGGSFDLLVITGPNTGGKTVTLKTIGLFTLMGQSGLHIPAFDNSELSVFTDVFADIGDEQSIEQSLSTFSSHMTNTVSILEHATPTTLCLFDELGAGTDPVEGAALAMSILSHLHNQGIRTVATTHYSELKVFALTTEGVENGSCEFDVETLRPTYRLLIGIPGKSNAFAISGKLGLPDYLIEQAKEYIDSENQSFEDVLSDLEKSRLTIEKEESEIARYKAEIEDLKKKLTIKNEKIDNAKEKILRRANEEAHAILQEAKDFADETIKKYNKWSKESGLNKAMEQERTELRKKLNSSEEKLALKNQKKQKKQLNPKDLRLGDAVMVLSLNLKGTVSSLPNAKGDLFVQMGILRSQVNINDLERIDEEVITTPNLKKTGSGKIKMSKAAAISPDINLIGLTTAEAIPKLDKYLDDAYLAHIPQVTVIHGRGTGALRNAVHAHLKKCKYVKSYRIGEFGEGDQGVTIVTFK
ncbi:MAG: endonuclease MutS2 [Lachnospiraceae bacterium]|nr:endonuclease MutS2 [Lachnospiraceae bacterium]